MKTKYITAALAALTLAAPLVLSTSAGAAPMPGKANIQIARYDAHDRGRGHMDMFHDRNHRPPQKAEYRSRQPHGHYRWRSGAWNWRGNMWTWTPGIWIRF